MTATLVNATLPNIVTSYNFDRMDAFHENPAMPKKH
jgi:hypothetical protein